MKTIAHQGLGATAAETDSRRNTPATPGPRSAATWTSLGLLALLVLVGLVWFATLGTRSLVSPDEGRYASLALEMARSGDWVTPRLNGLLYFEKPILQYWIGALAFLGFGVSEFTARLWPGVAGFLTLLAVGFTAGRLWGREAGIQALAVAASMTWIIGNSHFLTLDTGLTLFLTLALCAVLLAHANPEPRARRRWIWLAWAAMAGAVLSKGLVGIVIPGAVLVVVSLWRRDAGLWRGMHWASGLVIFFALAAPWFVLVSMRNPSFAEFFFIHEHFARYLTQVHQREGAWWYYVPFLLGGMLPWTGALPWLFRKDPAAQNGPSRIQTRDVLLVWCAFIFLFFSASGSKLPSYILPMFPALALLVTMQLRNAAPSTLRWHLLLPTLAWVLLLALAINPARFASVNSPIEVLQPLANAARLGAVIFLVGALAAWWCLGRRKVTVAVLCVAFAHLIASSMVIQAHNTYGQLKSAAPLAAALQSKITPDTPVFAVRTYDQTLPFYLGRNVVLVDYEDEFTLGQTVEPQRWIKTLDEFAAKWQSLPQAAAYMTKPTWLELQQRGLPMHIVFEDQRRVVVLKK
ncbi:glycosyltransferase family 39 protein [Variovorax sp. Sphag1AA]|uniref:glycosyltransferase family 39 protein n=1 Tax=Variovorax sp. Sphag1AA TaxID=2587027 RepID=UPI00160C7A4B|nr:glycosyltransferase family 39 protein [Variovorax sp. Sphag1AA]MBB3179835.1 4-amino-4-deoxy-L-arabinose transferase-like glycosyltransferase [Variovorax sp. Sphag1AA]